MFGNGAGIGIAVAITAAVQVRIRQVLRAGRTVCGGAVAGPVVPLTAELRVGAGSTRTTAPTTATTAASVSGSAGQSLNF